MGYHGEGNWPVRVDEHVHAPVDHWVQSACVMCSNGELRRGGLLRSRLLITRHHRLWVRTNPLVEQKEDSHACFVRSADIGVSKDDKIVGIRGRAVDRINKGRLGPKGMCSWEYNGHPDRLTFPVSPVLFGN